MGAEALSLAEVGFAALVQAGHHIDSQQLRQSRQSGKFAKSPVSQQDVARLEHGPESMEQAQVMVVQVAEHDIEHRAAAQGEEHHKFEHGKAAAGLLNGRLRVAFLVLAGIGQLCGRGIDDLNRPTVDLAARADAAVRHLGGGADGLFQSLSGQALSGLDIGRVAFVDGGPAVQAQEGLDLAHDLPAGGLGFEHLPDEALEGEAQAKDPLTAIDALIGSREQGGGQEVAQVFLKLGQGGLAEGMGRAASQSGQTGAEGGEQGVCIRSPVASDIVSINTYLIDNSELPVFNGPMQKTRLDPMRLTGDYRELQRQLAHIGYLSQGSVFERTPGQQGSPYVWTRKVHAKTITVALSQEQYQWLRQAVLNQRQLEKIVARMQTLSRQILFETVPGVVRRKRLGKRVLGLI